LTGFLVTGADLATGFFYTTGVSSDSESDETAFATFLATTVLTATFVFTISSEDSSSDDD
jgi:hypothetical protein